MPTTLDPFILLRADSIVTLKDGRQAHYRGPATDGVSAEVVILPGNTVTRIDPEEIAAVQLSPRDLANFWIASLQPAKTITVEAVGDLHVASVQVGPNLEAFHAVEAENYHEAIVQAATEAGLFEVKPKEG